MKRYIVILSFCGYRNRHKVVTGLFAHDANALPFVHILPTSDNSERIIFFLNGDMEAKLRARLRKMSNQNFCTLNTTIYKKRKQNVITLIKNQVIRRISSDPNAPMNIVRLLESINENEITINFP